MIQIIVATHGSLARELVRVANLIVGEQPGLTAVGLEAHEGIEDLTGSLSARLQQTDKEGCLLLVDMFGGTPSNVAVTLLKTHAVQVVTGVNLPMLLEALIHRGSMGLPELAGLVKEKGIKGIMNASELFS
jgi:mannose PTS system EIIA component